MYIFDGSVADRAASLAFSPRRELEIIDLIRTYLDERAPHVEPMGRGFAWLNTGTHDSLLKVAEFIRTLQHRQGIKIACLEEIAYAQGFITADEARAQGRALKKTVYGGALLAAVHQRMRHGLVTEAKRPVKARLVVVLGGYPPTGASVT